jgi:hypothetical protein
MDKKASSDAFLMLSFAEIALCFKMKFNSKLDETVEIN